MIDYIINILKGIFQPKEEKDYILEEQTVERKPKEIKVGKKKQQAKKKTTKKKTTNKSKKKGMNFT